MECYGRAANLYKMAKKWSQAGQTFVTVATHHAKLGNKHDSATNYVDAANCYKKSDPKGKHTTCSNSDHKSYNNELRWVLT